jgi:hypothetical protein
MTSGGGDIGLKKMDNLVAMENPIALIIIVQRKKMSF